MGTGTAMETGTVMETGTAMEMARVKAKALLRDKRLEVGLNPHSAQTQMYFANEKFLRN
jgi:hypothetical protein